jgi:recombinational DNA repair protein RecT
MRRFVADSEQIEAASKMVREAIKTERRRIRSVSDLVHSLKREIAAMRMRGDSWQEISRILGSAGVKVSRAALARTAPAILEGTNTIQMDRERKKKRKEVTSSEDKKNRMSEDNALDYQAARKTEEPQHPGPKAGTFRIRPDRDDL